MKQKLIFLGQTLVAPMIWLMIYIVDIALLAFFEPNRGVGTVRSVFEGIVYLSSFLIFLFQDFSERAEGASFLKSNLILSFVVQFLFWWSVNYLYLVARDFQKNRGLSKEK